MRHCPGVRRILVFTFLIVVAAGGTAFAYNENLAYPYGPVHTGECESCHMNGCVSCHSTHSGAVNDYGGPHGGYATTTNKCEACHEVHGATGDLKLLPGNTINASCRTCHDGTGGNGVYGALTARGIAIGGAHRIDTANAIPGGDSATGGSATRVFKGEGGMLTCTDCHSPHESDVVAPYYSDRRRSVLPTALPRNPVPESNKLLKRQPTGATASVAEYGSDWCLGCHAGRDSGGAVHNHPVESAATVATPYVYRNLPVLDSDGPTSATTLGQLGGRPAVRGSGNRGYLMPFPRTAQQAGHNPICMQCHEDARDVGSLDDAGAGTAQASIVGGLDGTVASDNPRFQNFPHETANAKMVVETGDDLCMNCHPAAALP